MLQGPQYAHLGVDVTAPQEVAFVPRACQQHFGSPTVHCLVNNAGVADPHMPARAETAAMVSHWRSVIDTNLTGGAIMECMAAPQGAGQGPAWRRQGDGPCLVGTLCMLCMLWPASFRADEG